MDCPVEWVSSSPEETISLGEKLGRSLKPGAVIALRGGLGAGKTCFAKGIALGLEIQDEVTSPTYTLLSEYQGKYPLYHFDAYRLNGAGDFALLGADELFDGGGITVIEWPEKIAAALPPESIQIEIAIQNDGRRVIRCAGGIRQ